MVRSGEVKVDTPIHQEKQRYELEGSFDKSLIIVLNVGQKSLEYTLQSKTYGVKAASRKASGICITGDD